MIRILDELVYRAAKLAGHLLGWHRPTWGTWSPGAAGRSPHPDSPGSQRT